MPAASTLRVPIARPRCLVHTAAWPCPVPHPIRGARPRPNPPPSFAAVLLAVPLAIACFWVNSVAAHLICIIFLLSVLGAYLGPSFAIAQTLAPIHMRAMSTALFFFVLNIIALGFGPTTTGILIDYFATNNTPLQATRLSLTAISFALVLSLVFFLMAAKTLPKDWATAEARNEAGA